jgi:pimeloyl-ACP methyl ester carboxylesterase
VVPTEEFAAAVNLKEKGVKMESVLLLPGKVARVRAAIVVVRYGLGGSSCCYYDPEWLQLAERSGAALLLARVSAIPGDSKERPWNNAAVGGDEALLRVLTQLAQESRRPELKDAPLVFWGHSAAGPFGTTFAALHPHRTIAFVRYHSGGVSANPKTVSQIPGLFLIGGKDTDFPKAVTDAEQLWKSGRSLSAPWTWAIEPDATHGNVEDVKRANRLLIPWVEAILQLRLSDDDTKLRAVPGNTGWLGERGSNIAVPVEKFTGDKTDASWLPDERTALAWQALSRQQ